MRRPQLPPLGRSSAIAPEEEEEEAEQEKQPQLTITFISVIAQQLKGER